MDVGESSTTRPPAEQGDTLLTLDDEQHCVIELSPDKTKHWIPICDQVLKPSIGRRFHTLDEAIACYMEYAAFCGFEVRHSTVHRVGNVVRLKYLVCKREGTYNGSNSKGLRASKVSDRVGCRARVVFVKDGGYVVKVFEERHTHNMMPNLSKQVSKSNGNVDAVVIEKSVEIDERKIIIGGIFSEVHACVQMIENDTTRLKEFARMIKEYKGSLMACGDGKNSAPSMCGLVKESVGVSVPSQGKMLQPNQAINERRDERQACGDGNNSARDLVKEFVGISVEFVGTVSPSQGKALQSDETIINKGSAKSLKGGKEKQMEKRETPKRKCRECMQYATHDSRNCKRIMLEKALQTDQTIINMGSDERLVGSKEEQMEKSKKPKRKCKECMQYAAHDSRNCKRIMLQKKRQEELAEQATEKQWEI